MSARDAISYLQVNNLVPNVPLPIVTQADANKLLVVNNTGTSYILSAGEPVTAGVNSVTCNDLSIDVTPTEGTGDVVITVAGRQVLTELTVGEAVYPNTLGEVGQAIGITEGGSLGYITVGGGGGGSVTSVGQGASINVDNTTDPAVPVVRLANDVNVVGTFSVKNIDYPDPETAQTGQVLSCISTEPFALGWANPSPSGGITSVEKATNDASTNNLSVTTNSQVVTIGLSDTPIYNSMTLKGNLDFAATSPATSDITGLDSITSLNVTATDMIAANLYVVQGVNPVQFPALTFDSGDNGKVLTLNTTGTTGQTTMTWSPSGGGGGGNVNSVTAGASTNITCQPTTGNVVVDLTDDIAVDSVNLKSMTISSPDNTSVQVLPQLTNGQVLEEGYAMITTATNNMKWAPIITEIDTDNLSVVPSGLDPSIINVNLLANTIVETSLTCPRFVISSTVAGRSITLPILTQDSFPPSGAPIVSDGNGGSGFTTTLDINEILATSVDTSGFITEAFSITTQDASQSINFPTAVTLPTTGQYLQVESVAAGVATLSFTDNFPDGVQSIASSNNTITVSGTDNVDIVVNPDLEVTGVTVQNFGIISDDRTKTIVFPTAETLPTIGQYLQVASVNGGFADLAFASSFPDGVQSVEPGNNTISVTGTEDVVLEVNPDLTITKLTAGNCIVDGTVNQIKTSTFTPASGITGGDHVMTQTAIAQTYFVTSSNQVTGEISSYRLPKITAADEIPLNSIIVIDSAYDTNKSQDSNFTTLNTLVATAATDIVAGGPDAENKIPLNLNAANKNPGNILTVSQDGVSIEWALNASTSSSTTYYLNSSNSAVVGLLLNMVFKVMARGDGSKSAMITQLVLLGDNYAPIRTGSESTTGFFLTYYDEQTPSTCLTYIEGDDVTPENYVLIYAPSVVGPSVPLAGSPETVGTGFPEVSMGYSPVQYFTYGGGSTQENAILQVTLTSDGINFDFVVPSTGNAFTVTTNKNVAFQYEQAQPVNFSATYF